MKARTAVAFLAGVAVGGYGTLVFLASLTAGEAIDTTELIPWSQPGADPWGDIMRFLGAR